MTTPVKEVCVESLAEALKAVAAGATRIELCENLSQGGTTPSYGTIKKCLQRLAVPIMVMIRPRGGNFVYSVDEYDVMMEDIAVCKELGVHGVVFGMLDASGKVDESRTLRLAEHAKPLAVTFHKAIDDSADLLESINILKRTGVSRVLTSGGEATAMAGRKKLNKMIAMSKPEITIIVAGKVTWENWEEVQAQIPASEYHGRKLVQF